MYHPGSSQSKVYVPVPPRAPNVKIVASSEAYLKFVLSDTDTSVANALRRVMIAEVPTMAIDLVTVSDNSSVLHDEFIAHRLGLLPIHVGTQRGVEQFNYQHACNCAGMYCQNCSVLFELDVKNDGPEGIKTVYTTDLVTRTEGVEVVGYSSREESTLGGEEFAGKGIVIAKLGLGQRLRLQAIAVKGIGKIHAKWSPVAVATFTMQPRVTLNDARLDELADAQRAELVASCPATVFGFDERSKKVVINKEDACMFCNECVKVGRSFREKADDDNVVSVETVPSRYVFVVETTGALSPGEVVSLALRRLRALVTEVKTECEYLQQRGGLDALQPSDSANLPWRDMGGFV